MTAAQWRSPASLKEKKTNCDHGSPFYASADLRRRSDRFPHHIPIIKSRLRNWLELKVHGVAQGRPRSPLMQNAGSGETSKSAQKKKKNTHRPRRRGALNDWKRLSHEKEVPERRVESGHMEQKKKKHISPSKILLRFVSCLLGNHTVYIGTR